MNSRVHTSDCTFESSFTCKVSPFMDESPVPSYFLPHRSRQTPETSLSRISSPLRTPSTRPRKVHLPLLQRTLPGPNPSPYPMDTYEQGPEQSHYTLHSHIHTHPHTYASNLVQHRKCRTINPCRHVYRLCQTLRYSE